METIVLKFGGSSLADNNKLNIVAKKIKEFYDKNLNLVVVVSAQGKTTDNFIKDAYSLSNVPDDRELDVLLSSGEQISIAKLAILLNSINIPTISLTGWQAGIYTNNTNQDAVIEYIDLYRINKELDNGKIVIVAGFQGLNEKMDITTLGRGGSDTTAVAIAAKLKANKCYIFSDVDGVYSTDPKQTKCAKKLDEISYKEMIDISNEGAKVLHNRCVEIAEKYNIPIIAQSTFNSNKGTIINNKIESGYVKSIVKNDNLKYVHLKSERYSLDKITNLYKKLIDNNLNIKNIINNSRSDLDINFTIPNAKLIKLEKIIKEELLEYNSNFSDITKISIIGNGIVSNNTILKDVLEIIENNKLEIINMEISENKIAIIFNKRVSNIVLEELHNKLI